MSYNYTIYGTNGRDYYDLDYSYDNYTAYLLKEEDTIYLGEGSDTVYGAGGNDYISLGGGNDTAYGGDAHDTIVGGYGYNSLHGERGNDRIYARDYNSTDYVYGDAGRDYIEVDSDVVFAGPDNDTVSVTDAFAGASINLGTGADTLRVHFNARYDPVYVNDFKAEDHLFLTRTGYTNAQVLDILDSNNDGWLGAKDRDSNGAWGVNVDVAGNDLELWVDGNELELNGMTKASFDFLS